MKKKVLLAAVLMVVVAFAAVRLFDCRGDIRGVERIVGQSSIYTEAEIQAAMDVVQQHFRKNFEGCKLLRIEYDEGKTLTERYYRSEQYGVERTIVLESDVYVGFDADGSLNPDYTYNDWKWILTDEGDGWVLRTAGYG